MTEERWVSATERPLLVAAGLFLVVLCLPVIEPHMPRGESRAVSAANYAIWAAFALDYAVRLRLAADRRRFVRTHIPDLLVVVLPALRPLRLLRLLSLGRVLGRQAAGKLVGDVARSVSIAAAFLVFLGAVGVLDAERDAHRANITTFGDAMWWACTTVTTVGYGDRYPVTPLGRIIAVALMVSGLALLGILTAAIAAWFVRQVSHEADIEAGIYVEAAELHAIRETLASIETRLASAPRQ
jgi:voltage-gated potassium channel